MKIIVNTTDTNSRPSKDANKAPNVFQPILFDRGDGAVYPAEVLIRTGSKPYPVGAYEVSPESFYTGEYGKIQFRAVPGKLISAAKAA